MTSTLSHSRPATVLDDATIAQRPGRSVYGLTVHGLDDVSGLLPRQPPAAETTEILVDQLDAEPPPAHELDDQRVVRQLSDGRHLEMDRTSGRARFYGPRLESDVLAHPYLAPIGVTFNRWAGREAFHAGAFVAGNRAWIVVGGRTAGKSTLMAALAAADVPVLADDIAITDGNVVFAGPRTVDLREPVPGLPMSLNRSRNGTRFRVPLPVVPDRVALGGWIFLRWEPVTTLRPVAPRDLLSRVAARRVLPGLPSDPAVVLDLAAAPAFVYGRPRDWAALPASIDLLRAVTIDAWTGLAS